MTRVLVAVVLFALPAAAAPLPPGAPRFELRLEGVFGQPTTRLGSRGGGALGIAWRLTDQIAMIGDGGARFAPGGGIGALAFGLQATLDATPIAPWLELAVVDVSNRRAVGYTLATRIGVGADWMFSRAVGIGVAVRTYTALDPENDIPSVAGVEGAIRLIVTSAAF